MGDRILRALALVALVAGTASAGGRVVGTVRVTDGGQVVSTDVIVYVTGFTEAAPEAIASDAPIAQIEQKGRTFMPDLIAVTAGESVSFPNRDSFLHNVFSQSAARKFDLGSFKRGETKDKSFPHTGVVEVYCNIHPEMAATILVLPNTRHTRAAADGSFAISGVPAGTWTVFAYTRRAVKPTSMKVTVTDGADTTVKLSLVRGAEPAHTNKFGERYKVYR